MRRSNLSTEPDFQFPGTALIVFGLLGFWLLDNFLISWFLNVCQPDSFNGLLVYGSLGVIASEVILIAFMLALYPAGILFRIVTATGAGILLCLPLLLGSFFFSSQLEILRTAHSLPLIILAIASAFALKRHISGWRLQFNGIAAPLNSKLSIAELMITTALVAVAINVLQFGNDVHIFFVFIVSGTCVIASFFFFVPQTWCVLRRQRFGIWLVVYPLGAFGLSEVAMLTFQHFAGAIPFWAKLGISLFFTTLFLSYGFSLVVLRLMGGRLVYSSELANRSLSDEKNSG